MTNAPVPAPKKDTKLNQVLDASMFNRSGVITVINWTMASDGETYLYFYSDNWMIITDAMMPIEHFHSSEKWQLIAIRNDIIVAIFPGCQVKGFISCDSCPNKRSTFDFSKEGI